MIRPKVVIELAHGRDKSMGPPQHLLHPGTSSTRVSARARCIEKKNKDSGGLQRCLCFHVSAFERIGRVRQYTNHHLFHNEARAGERGGGGRTGAREAISPTPEKEAKGPGPCVKRSSWWPPLVLTLDARTYMQPTLGRKVPCTAEPQISAGTAASTLSRYLPVAVRELVHTPRRGMELPGDGLMASFSAKTWLWARQFSLYLAE